MPTKDELVAFGEAHGIDVDMSMLKEDIEASIRDAGYDPTTVGETPMSEEPTNGESVAEEIRETSSDARFATYEEVQPDTEERPPPGRQVQQTRGKPTED